MRIGIAGVGKLGASIAARLDGLGENVRVWNRTRDRAVATGLPVAATPEDLASCCDVVVSVLFDSAAQRDVNLGSSGLLSSCKGRLFIDMSTVHPDSQRFLESEVHRAGNLFLECPVGGTTGPARAGQLLGLAGGTVQAFEQARPILDKLCRRIEHVGPMGSGALAKLAINLPLVVFWQSFGEALALMRSLDKDPRWLVDLFSETAGAAQVLKIKSDSVVAAMTGSHVEPTFDIDAMRKDMQTIISVADQQGCSVPTAVATLFSLNAAHEAGLGGTDCATHPASLWGGKLLLGPNT
jgi:3-hydroxyisobutyrate dehydrogenase